jgi:hypothetical protein
VTVSVLATLLITPFQLLWLIAGIIGVWTKYSDG